MPECLVECEIQHVNANAEETLDRVPARHLSGLFTRLATLSLTPDSTNPAEIRCPAR